MLDLWGKMVPNLPNEALKVRYDATLGRLQDMNETEKKPVSYTHLDVYKRQHVQRTE